MQLSNLFNALDLFTKSHHLFYGGEHKLSKYWRHFRLIKHKMKYHKKLLAFDLTKRNVGWTINYNSEWKIHKQTKVKRRSDTIEWGDTLEIELLNVYRRNGAMEFCWLCCWAFSVRIYFYLFDSIADAIRQPKHKHSHVPLPIPFWFCRDAVCDKHHRARVFGYTDLPYDMRAFIRTVAATKFRLYLLYAHAFSRWRNILAVVNRTRYLLLDSFQSPHYTLIDLY